MKRLGATKIILGTRGSALAREQARIVAEKLQARWADLKIEIKIIRTSGEESAAGKIPQNARAGRKGLFTGEIERALAARTVDLAVHSAKDLPSELQTGTEIGAVLARGSVDDVLVAMARCDFRSLPGGGIIATGSVRRKHQLHWRRPDLEVVELRGNVTTRLRKLSGGQWHALILARAGLERLGLKMDDGHLDFEGAEFFISILPQEIFLPAGGQGVIALQIRSDDERLRAMIAPLNDFATRLCLRAEREFLRLLNADCNQPVGVLAKIEKKKMKLRAQIFDLGATVPRQAEVEGRSEEAEGLAGQLWQKIDEK